MKYDLNRPVKSFSDEILTDGETQCDLAYMIIGALFSNLPGDENLTANQKLDLYALALKVKNKGTIEFTR